VHARRLRREPTEAEKRLWRLLARRQIKGCKFRRQHPIGPYIVDFVCLERNLVVEVDGGQHALESAERQEWLETEGYRVLRFWNNEILENLEGVHRRIVQALESLPP
jgi:very-short-patch-repair endonuclease